MHVSMSSILAGTLYTLIEGRNVGRQLLLLAHIASIKNLTFRASGSPGFELIVTSEQLSLMMMIRTLATIGARGWRQPSLEDYQPKRGQQSRAPQAPSGRSPLTAAAAEASSDR